MSRISRLEKRLAAMETAYGARFEQLECDHDIVAKENVWWFGIDRWTECSKCGKYFDELTEQEYLEISIKNNKKQCASDRKELEERLAKLKEESDE